MLGYIYHVRDGLATYSEVSPYPDPRSSCGRASNQLGSKRQGNIYNGEI